MTMQAGNSFLLQVSRQWDTNDYVTVAACRSNGLNLSSAMVDVTNRSSNGWAQATGGGGIKSASLSASGIVNTGSSQDLLLDAFDSEIQATGTVTFPSNPSVNDTLILNGVTFTFVASASTATQVTIGADLSSTIDNLVSKLNDSVNASISVATYLKVDTDKLRVIYDTVGQTGNTYTLNSGVGTKTLSGSTLNGGRKNDTLWNFQIVDGSGYAWRGPFHIESLSFNGERNDVQTFEVSLSSAGRLQRIQL